MIYSIFTICAILMLMLTLALVVAYFNYNILGESNPKSTYKCGLFALSLNSFFLFPSFCWYFLLMAYSLFLGYDFPAHLHIGNYLYRYVLYFGATLTAIEFLMGFPLVFMIVYCTCKEVQSRKKIILLAGLVANLILMAPLFLTRVGPFEVIRLT